MISTKSSVIFFGGLHYRELFGNGWDHEDAATDRVVEFKNLNWVLLGNLVMPRQGHRSIQIDNKIYIFGGRETS